MPLQQLDANLRAYSIPARSRDSFASDASYAHTRDENSALPPKQPGSKTPPSERLLAPTRSSAAKAASAITRPGKALPPSPPFVSLASPATGQPDTPPMSPAIVPKWSDRVVRRIISRERVAKHSEPSSPSTHALDMPPLPAVPVTEKPLPSRPIASVASDLSPSKDSRTLIDAVEKPLQMSQEGSARDWPALTPRSVSAPEPKRPSFSRDLKSTPSAIPRRISTKSIARTSADAVKMLDKRMARNSNASVLTQHSSDPSFVSAEEPNLTDHTTERASMSLPSLVHTPQHVAPAPQLSTPAQTTQYPARMQSLGHRLGNGNLTQPKRASGAEMPRRLSGIAGPNTPMAQPRGHSPSPASFSRPRPGSGAYAAPLPSLPKDTPPSTAEKVLHQRTASRIPIPDSKKATLVDIRTLPPPPNSEGSPSFGARRLVSPGALAILDQGTKRRLQRANTNGSTASTESSSTRILNLDHVNEKQQRSRSKSSSPGDTFGPSSSDEEEVVTPVMEPFRLRNGASLKSDRATDMEDQFNLTPDELRFRSLRRAPPSKSPFTGPLQTIHSQATLAMPHAEDSPTKNACISHSNQFSNLARRLHHLKSSHGSDNYKDDDTEPVNQQGSQHLLRQLLEETQCQDQICQNSGMPGLDKETKNHLTQTLCLLEGHGSPTQDNFDHGKLEQMFGQLVPGINRASKTNTLLNDATAATRFLEGDSRDSVVENPSPDHVNGIAHGGSGGFNDDATVAELPANDACQTPAVSKWSDSTPSAQGNSTDLNRKEPQCSIGYPSATHAPGVRSPAHLTHGRQRNSGFSSRNSSPTLGHSKRGPESILAKGSVQRGHKAGERAGFARMTASAASKKIPRAAGSRPNIAQPPRSRSKSRTVLDKINGFFSHKRDKKTEDGSEAPPPLPPLDFGNLSTRTTAHIDESNSPFPQLHRMNRTTSPPLTSVPETSTCPPSQDHRSFSRASDKSMASILPLDGDCDGTVLTLTDKLVTKAKQEKSVTRKQRLTNFAHILNDALIHVREAKISAETARQMADQAELSYLKTQKGVDMLSRLASSLVQGTVRR
ncbi:uncharacterized protein MYCFIDRAFT_81830 [Pseudocercospora fijiensis CIRAD86]|uniref:Uncharacterized protein n=1 Tax=Pseudocercospora fijiensis (strain CIRAD86) TaxID=383855 RepID=M2ZWC2_PSEFD|nr:uncharacterized protein MYCFIDRAFT_81830 [Pseudocercospora fijiensis CIRAD86]EME83284.1 hypothetical protein MYCFIDRAFT_81830 [Pseudocercospora fijiensis CIRAD86]